MLPIPQGLLDALNSTQQALEDAAQASFDQDAAARAAVKAQQDLDTANTTLATKATALDKARQNLEAIEDAYFQIGGTTPPPAPAPAPAPTV